MAFNAPMPLAVLKVGEAGLPGGREGGNKPSSTQCLCGCLHSEDGWAILCSVISIGLASHSFRQPEQRRFVKSDFLACHLQPQHLHVAFFESAHWSFVALSLLTRGSREPSQSFPAS